MVSMSTRMRACTSAHTHSCGLSAGEGPGERLDWARGALSPAASLPVRARTSSGYQPTSPSLRLTACPPRVGRDRRPFPTGVPRAGISFAACFVKARVWEPRWLGGHGSSQCLFGDFQNFSEHLTATTAKGLGTTPMRLSPSLPTSQSQSSAQCHHLTPLGAHHCHHLTLATTARQSPP